MEQSLFDGSGAPVPDPDPDPATAECLSRHLGTKNLKKKTRLPNQWWNPNLPVSNYLFTPKKHRLIVLVDWFYFSHLKTGVWKPWWNGFFHPQIGSQLIFTTQHFVRWWKPGTQSFTIGKAARGTWREWQPAYWNLRSFLVLQTFQSFESHMTWFSLTNIHFSKKKAYDTWKLMAWKMVPKLRGKILPKANGTAACWWGGAWRPIPTCSWDPNGRKIRIWRWNMASHKVEMKVADDIQTYVYIIFFRYIWEYLYIYIYTYSMTIYAISGIFILHTQWFFAFWSPTHSLRNFAGSQGSRA